jgi:hypothetical protein
MYQQGAATIMTFGIDRPTASPDDVAAVRYAAIEQARESVVAESRAAEQASLDLKLWDIRLAAILNTLSLAMEHGQHRDWTHDHARQIREMLAIVDDAADDGAVGAIPPGFGPVVRTAHAAALVKIAGRVNGARGGETAGTEGGQV